ncbi:MAG: DegT/DnrJ/EryC1/StrS aminotransferase family protein [Kiritimatiellae bacterium]|nr:DegT/DnrJ/EryC1/StrS aminotransferase family protein [Kiritimatiellia bacterium]
MADETELPVMYGGRPVRDSFLPFARPRITEADIQGILGTLQSGWLATGEKTARFEEAFGSYVGSRYAVGLTSGTAGIALALRVAGVGAGDEVITTPMTFAATAAPIVHAGAVPVFADIDRSSFNINPDQAASRITKRTKALLAVHFAGRPCAMGELRELANTHGLVLISDAAHAIEARYDGRKLAEWSDVSAFSFHPNKNITTGEGGMLTTDRQDWAEHARRLRFHGIARLPDDGFPVIDIVEPGFKYNMSDLQASLGLTQLENIEACLESRRAVFEHYNEAFRGMQGVSVPPPVPERSRHAMHMYNILLDTDGLCISRNRFCRALNMENIGAGVHYRALHQMSFYREHYQLKDVDYPESTFVSERILTLPLFAGMGVDDAQSVVEAVSKILCRCRRSEAR